MAEIHCPLCGRKNWLPDGAEPKCFFCGNPLPPEPDLSQNVQYAPPPEPETEESPFIEEAMAVPFRDPSTEKEIPAKNDAEAPLSGIQQKPCTPKRYRMADMTDLPPKIVRSPEQKARAKLKYRQWFLMNTVFVCMQGCLTQMTFYFDRINSPLEIVGFALFISIPVFSYISNYLRPDDNARKADLLVGSFFEIIVSGFFAELGLNLYSGFILAIVAGTAVSALTHYGGRLLRDDRT